MKPKDRVRNIRRRRRQRNKRKRNLLQFAQEQRTVKPRVRKYLTDHHLTPKVRGGTRSESNLLTLWNDKHELWHMLFGERTLEEVIDLLERIARAKRRKVAA